MCAAMVVAFTSCKKETAATNVESLKFANSTYSVDESDMSDKLLNLKVQLVAVPEGILDTAKIIWSVTPEDVATIKDNCVIPKKMGSAVVTATVQNKSAECEVNIYSSVTDCTGKKYKTVKIGKYTWTTENLDCLVYDTESESEIGQLSYVDDVFNKDQTYAPYCVNPKDETKWAGEDNAEAVTTEHVMQFGTMYNWGAAVGLATTSEIVGTKEFSGFRQGICPNGWHLPKDFEIKNLIESVGGSDIAGKKLKSTSGWHDGGNGTDDFGFNFLPSGACSLGTMVVFLVGGNACFWASGAPDYDDATYSLFVTFDADGDYASACYITKRLACSVRCVKNY